jgi:hypothetical protein
MLPPADEKNAGEIVRREAGFSLRVSTGEIDRRKNCRLEKGAVSTGMSAVKILVKICRLEIMPILCFDGVAAISNRGSAY